MTELSSVRQLQPLEESSASRQAMASTGVMGWLRATFSKGDLVIVIAVCLLGLLLTFTASLKVPDFTPATGEIISGP